MKYFLSILFFIWIPAVTAAKIIDEKKNWQSVCCSDHNIIYAGGKNCFQYFENNRSHVITLPAETHITALYAYGQHVLIGTGDGRLYSYSSYQESLHFIVNVQAEISNIMMLHGSLYITTLGRGYAVFRENKFRFYNTGRDLKDDHIYQLVAGRDGGVWGCSDHGIFYQNDSVVYPAFNTKLKDKIVTALDISGPTLYAGSQQGYLSEISLTDTSVFHFENVAWSASSIHDLKVYDGVVLFACANGVFSLDRSHTKRVDTLETGREINDLMTDHSGALWMAGDHFLAKHYPEFFRLLTQNVQSVHAITNGGDSTIWFTPDSGLSNYDLRNHSMQQILPGSGLLRSDITCLFTDIQQNLWIGTSGDGLLVYNIPARSVRKLNIDISSETSQVLSVSGNAHYVWATTLNGVWFTGLKDSAHTFYSLEDKLRMKKNYVYQILPEGDHILWLATDGHGILKIQDTVVEAYSQRHDIKSNTFYTVIRDSAANMWFNAYQNGLYCVHNDTVFHLNKDNGLQSDDIAGFCMLNGKTLLAVSSVGADLINIEQLSVTQVPFSIADYAVVPELNSITRAGATVCIGTDKGILLFQFPVSVNMANNKPFISSVEVLNKPVPITTHRFKYRENFIKFNIASGHTFEENIFVRYKLEGLSNNWSTTLDNEITYPRLNPGRYTFRLQSANNSLFNNATEQSWRFEIDSPFWRKWWFLLIMCSLTFFGIWQYVRYREQKVSGLQQLAKEKAIAEFEALKAQVNPHFLFNSFNTLMQVIDDDREKAIEYTQRLSDFYRALIAFKEHDIVTLDKELEMLDNYFYLQQMRFGPSLIFEQQIHEAEQKQIFIPPLTLQLLAENAVKHNIITANKKLRIRMYTEGDHVVFENNIQLKMTREKGEGLGLKNIQNRYSVYSKKDIIIQQTETAFIVKLPKI